MSRGPNSLAAKSGDAQTNKRYLWFGFFVLVVYGLVGLYSVIYNYPLLVIPIGALASILVVIVMYLLFPEEPLAPGERR